MTLNRINLIGRAGRDPEVKYFDSGKVVCKFSIAVNRRSRTDEPDWFELEMWGKTAETAGEYVRKGKQVGIVGSLKIDRWQDKNTGEERSRPVVMVDQLELLGSKADAEGGAAKPGYTDDF
ncbi:MAG: single-stranded DNA-binding protein [Pseudanabaenaceae cyanobacterium bins.68]|nr:single-stranded DNA-binding protein [Pseudanabaenaceae cyanobacterium bins.68]